MTAPRTRQRDKLAPDPAVRRAILSAALTVLRENGVHGLGIASVLERAGLSTRAFYRHFDSKDQLIAAVFSDLAHRETRRLRRKMAAATTAVDAVVAWIDGRLDLAFDESVRSDLRRMSQEAQSQIFASPQLVQPAYAQMLSPLVEQLKRGVTEGDFHDIDPLTDAQSIQGTVWACTERHWATGESDHAEVRSHVLRFCLRGLGVDPEQATTKESTWI